MNEQIMIVAAIVAVGLCSVCFVVLVPAVAMAAVRGNGVGALRLIVACAALAVGALTVSALLGAMPGAHAILT